MYSLLFGIDMSCGVMLRCLGFLVFVVVVLRSLICVLWAVIALVFVFDSWIVVWCKLLH